MTRNFSFYQIVSCSRRRQTSNFAFFPPTIQVLDKSETASSLSRSLSLFSLPLNLESAIKCNYTTIEQFKLCKRKLHACLTNAQETLTTISQNRRFGNFFSHNLSNSC